MEKDFETVWRNFFSKYRLFKYKRGENIYRPGEYFEQIGFVNEGFVRCYSIDDEAKEVTMNSFKPVFYLTLLGAMSGSENKYYFECLTDVEMWKVPKQDLVDFLKSNPEQGIQLVKRVLLVMDQLLDSCRTRTSDAYKKVAGVIYAMTKNNGSDQLQFKVSHRIIASLIGISRETASIQVKKLEREGLIEQNKGYMKIVDQKKYRDVFGLD